MASTADQDAFKSNPASILSVAPEGGGLLARNTRELVLADTDLHKSVLGVAPSANDQQQASLGVGLGQATRACSRSNPVVAQQISVAVLASGYPKLIDAFKTTMQDIETLAVAGGSPPSTPSLGGNDANSIFGGQGSASSGGVPQAGFKPAALGFGGTPAPNNLVASALPLSPSSSSSSSGGVPTVPGPVMGEGPAALLIGGAAVFFLLRRRANAAKAEG